MLLSVADHLYSVLVFTRLTKSLKHLEENTDIVSFGYAVTIWIDFKSPGKTICQKRFRIDNFMTMSDSAKVFYAED